MLQIGDIVKVIVAAFVTVANQASATVATLASAVEAAKVARVLQLDPLAAAHGAKIFKTIAAITKDANLMQMEAEKVCCI